MEHLATPTAQLDGLIEYIVTDPPEPSETLDILCASIDFLSTLTFGTVNTVITGALDNYAVVGFMHGHERSNAHS